MGYEWDLMVKKELDNTATCIGEYAGNDIDNSDSQELFIGAGKRQY